MNSGTTADSRKFMSSVAESEIVASPDSVLPDAILCLLKERGISIDTPDVFSVKLEAVPVGKEFNKQKTNLLLQRQLYRSKQWRLYVDSDLKYIGKETIRCRLFSESCSRNWRGLSIESNPMSLAQAFLQSLSLLDSPLSTEVRMLLAPDNDLASSNLDDVFGEFLSSYGELILPEQCSGAYKRTSHRELAEQLALSVSGTRNSQSVLLWGTSGVGKDALMLAVAHVLHQIHVTDRVIRIPAYRLAMGQIFPAEIDANLTRLLEAVQAKPCVLLIQDINVCFTGSQVSSSVLCGAIDKGVRFIASVQSKKEVRRFARDRSIARRILAVRVAPPSVAHLRDILQRIARDSHVTVHPMALDSIISHSQRGATWENEPGYSIALLQRAIQWAAYRKTQVDPDTVYAALKSEWPEN